MSLFFDDGHPIPMSFTVKQESSDGSYKDDTALLNVAFWNFLSSSQTGRVCLAIDATRSIDSSPMQTLICWAIPDEHTTELSIPQQWLQRYPQLFSSNHSLPLMVSTTQPVPLTCLVMTALSSQAYDIAAKSDSILTTWLSLEQPILRQGTVFSFSTDSFPTNGHVAAPQSFQYRLDMTEPTLQGYFCAGVTKVMLTLEDSATYSPGSVSEMTGVSDGELIEIDENFLANSALRSNRASPSSEPAPPNSQDGDHVRRNLLDLPSGPVLMKLRPLSTPMSSRDGYTLYLRTADLRNLGLLNGDWAIAHYPARSTSRVVCVASDDDLVQELGTVHGSPLLLHNICTEVLSSPEFILRFGPFGPQLPLLPTARKLTVARVSSAFSVDRTYQPLLLHALKAYFSQGAVLVKKGDLIGVPIDTDDLRRSGEIDIDVESLIINQDDRFRYGHPTSTRRFNVAVFFSITEVECDPLPNADKTQEFVSLSSGSLGCWVDPATTRIVQTGVVHSGIPDVAAYFEIDSSLPKRFLNKFSAPSTSLAPFSGFEKLLTWSRAALVATAANYNLHLSVLLKGAKGVGKFAAASWVAQQLGFHLLELNCYALLGESDVKTQGTLLAYFEKSCSCSPCVLVLRHIDALVQGTQSPEGPKDPSISHILQGCMNDCLKSWNTTGYPTLVIGTTSNPDRVPVTVNSCFKNEISLEAPIESERQQMLHYLLGDYAVAPDVSLSAIARQTAALVASDVKQTVLLSALASTERCINAVRPNNHSEFCASSADIVLTSADFKIGLSKVHSSYSEGIAAPKIPNISWDDVGGLAHVRSKILDTIQLPLDHPELFSSGVKKRSGILLYGPPGTGKTLLAKAVATTCSLNFFSVKGPELLNMYIGESEANVRRVFQRAKDAKPCVVFFDELDSIAPKRGNQGDSGGVMDRIVSQLLAEVDGISSGKEGTDIFVIGATNRPDLLDPALLRPGRFDCMLYLGISQTHQAQLKILQALTRKFQLDPALDLSRLAEHCSYNYTGADFYAWCSDAMLCAMSRKVAELDQKIADLNLSPTPQHPFPLTPQYYLAELATSADTEVLVTQHDFELALQDLVPSVSHSELQHYARIQRQFSLDEQKDQKESKINDH